MIIQVLSQSGTGSIEGRFSVSMAELLNGRERAFQDYILKEIAKQISSKYMDLNWQEIITQITPEMLANELIKQYHPEVKMVKNEM
jgi:hypothetical protein